MLSVGDQFGAEFAAGFGAGLKANKYDIVVQKSYPLGAADLTNEIKEVKASGADIFIAGSYPPDTFMLAQTSIAQGFNPKIYYTAVGTAFAEFGGAFKEKAEGVLGIGGWNPALPGAMDYYKRQVALTGTRRTAGRARSPTPACRYSQQAIEKAGTLDRKKVTEMIANGGPWQTVSGPIDLKTHIREKQWGVGQWQKGQFVGVAPGDLAGAQAGRSSPSRRGEALAPSTSLRVGRMRPKATKQSRRPESGLLARNEDETSLDRALIVTRPARIASCP